jgi:tungstate transport system substrate-binding protein
MQRLMAIVLALWLAGSAWAAEDIRLATTTSTENSGLLKVILPLFEAKYGGKVRVVSVGTGAALKLGENGDADVVLVHARPLEDKFMAGGFGSVRRDVMYNDFIIVGPKRDPAGVRGSKDAIAAMKKIAASGAKFVSRGDESGTHQMEKDYWKAAGVEPKGAWYVSSGQGMGQVLTMTGEFEGYTLTDRATYAAYKDKTGLETLVEGDPKMFNHTALSQSTAEASQGKQSGRNGDGELDGFAEGQKAIADFKINGVQMFYPTAK